MGWVPNILWFNIFLFVLMLWWVSKAVQLDASATTPLLSSKLQCDQHKHPALAPYHTDSLNNAPQTTIYFQQFHLVKPLNYSKHYHISKCKKNTTYPPPYHHFFFYPPPVVKLSNIQWQWNAEAPYVSGTLPQYSSHPWANGNQCVTSSIIHCRVCPYLAECHCEFKEMCNLSHTDRDVLSVNKCFSL